MLPGEADERLEDDMPSEAHEQVVQFLVDNPTPADASLSDRRTGFDQALLAMPRAADVEAETVSADGVSVDWVTVPGTRDDRVVVLIHGGGGCMGSAATYREFAGRVSRAAQARVAVVEYRLAPEAPFPAGVDDCVAAYRSILADGNAPERVIVAADSGGVGLALTVVARIRDEGIGLPAGVVGFSPWLDFAVGDSIADAEDVGDPMLTRDAHQFFAEQYLQDHPATDAAANILHADPAGLPPILLLTGTRDVVHADALRFAQLARRAGVEVTVRSFHGLVHNWVLWPDFPESADALAHLARFIDERVQDALSLTKER
jgi:monoterpene epsilon-lactone hydrolase